MINELAVVTYGVYGASTASERACLIATYGLLDDLPDASTPATSVIPFVFAARPTFVFAARPTFVFKKGS